MSLDAETSKIDASPTKDFFIYMLTKDIDLIRAIADLADNSIDGARKIRGKDSDYAGLYIRIEAEKDYFKIFDNCGGIAVEEARDHAFRFGRDKGMKETPYSIGQFGVGMKRALFKIGNYFRIESMTNSSRFVVEQDVSLWANDTEKWDFHFTELDENYKLPYDIESGTSIIVTQLHEFVSEEFQVENFKTRLTTELESAHRFSLNKGIAITLNGIPLRFRPAEVLASQQLLPEYRELSLEGDLVKVKLIAGIGVSDPPSAGWHVFCNGRLILEADKSRTTGWGDGNPQYHNQYARFRGYVFFDSDHAGLLPWTTTKSNVDADSPIFRAVRLEMLYMMRPIIDFLNKLDIERKPKEEGDPSPYDVVVDEAKPVGVTGLTTMQKFTVKMPERTSEPPNIPIGHIQYDKPQDQIAAVKKCLKLKSNKEVGEKTFEYFMKMECE